jgi:hypothetical protein
MRTLCSSVPSVCRRESKRELEKCVCEESVKRESERVKACVMRRGVTRACLEQRHEVLRLGHGARVNALVCVCERERERERDVCVRLCVREKERKGERERGALRLQPAAVR